MKLTPADLAKDQSKSIEQIAAESMFTVAGRSAHEAKRAALIAQQKAAAHLQALASTAPTPTPFGSRNTTAETGKK